MAGIPLPNYRSFNPPAHGFRPPHSNALHVPRPVHLPHPRPYVGRYLRESVLYMYEIAELYSHQHEFFAHQLVIINGGSNNQTRQRYFRVMNGTIQRENAILRAVLQEIRRACEYLHELHSARTTCLAQLHLQRRSMFLLDLCMQAIADSRIPSGLGVYFMSRAAVNNDPDNTTYYHHTALPQAHMSGLHRPADFFEYTRNVYIWMPQQYDPNVLTRVRLPAHFVNLLQTKFTQDFEIPVRPFRQLLLRYALFLAILIWRPAWYEEVRNHWNTFESILGLRWYLTPLQIIANGLVHPLTFGPRNILNSGRVDADVVSLKVWNWNFPHFGNGVDSREQTIPLDPIANFSTFLNQFTIWDIRRNLDTRNGIFFRII